MRVAIDIAGAAEARDRLLAAAARVERPVGPLFRLLGAEWEASFREHIRVQGVPDAFAALSPTTVSRRKKTGFGPTPILVRTGDLLQSIRTLEVTDSELSVGTLHVGAKLLQFGGTTSPSSALPNRPVPPRPFVLLTEQEISDTFEMVDAFFLDEGLPDG